MPLIALAENDPMQREMLGSLLQLQDPAQSVKVQSSGRELLEFLDDHKVDLVITELHLPDLDGLELIRQIRNQSHPIPVIALASTAGEFQQMAREVGAIACFEKPVDSDLLTAEVQRLLKLSKLEPIYNINIESVLQMVSGQQEDCILTILSSSKKGKLYFIKGNLVHARTLAHDGEEAIVEMLGWSLYHFSTQPLKEDVPITVEKSVITILMSAAVKRDEDGA